MSDLPVTEPYVPMQKSIYPLTTFGNPGQFGGPCIGKGVCKIKLLPPVPQGMIVVGFQISFHDPNVLIMSFNLQDLAQNQPDQVQYFTSAAQSYMFDQDYPLSDPIFAPLQLPPGSAILTTSPSQVEIIGNAVINFITYFHP